MSKTDPMIPLEHAFSILDRTLSGFRLPGEILPVQKALGRTVRGDQKSRLDLPPFDKSAMDGYALPAGDQREVYRVIETIPAGKLGTKELVAGTAVKVMTGAAVPPGTERVVMQEDTEQHGDQVKVLSHQGPPNICKQAEDVKVGDVVLKSGSRLGALEIANLVSCGIREVEVSRAPRLSIISTGDEIVDDPGRIEPGKIMNSNGPMLAALAEQFGLAVVGQRTLRDDEEVTTRGLRAALDEADIVVLSGGVSVGEFDYVLDAFGESDLRVLFSRVAVKPGKPTVFAWSAGKCAFGLPGNPVSVYLMFHLFVLRAAAHMTGGRQPVREIGMRLGRDYQRQNTERLQFVPCRMTDDGIVEAVQFHGSAHLSAVLEADGFFRVPLGTGRILAGQDVIFSPLPRVFR